MLVARPPAGPPLRADFSLLRAGRRGFAVPTDFLADPASRAQVGVYLADLTSAYGRPPPGDLTAQLGQSYGEMAQELIELITTADESVDLLILAFAVHDLRPGRQTAAYLSHLTPGAPAAFAICDQGSAAAFSGLRIAREYAATADLERVLLVVVEQPALPYDCPVPLPAAHQGVAMLYGVGAGDRRAPMARVIGVRQHGGVPPDAVARLAAAELAELTNGHDDALVVLGDSLATAWPAPAAAQVKVAPPGQPSTGVWWELVGALADHPGVVVAADYDSYLRYFCLTAFDPRPA